MWWSIRTFGKFHPSSESTYGLLAYRIGFVDGAFFRMANKLHFTVNPHCMLYALCRISHAFTTRLLVDFPADWLKAGKSTSSKCIRHKYGIKHTACNVDSPTFPTSQYNINLVSVFQLSHRRQMVCTHPAYL